MLKRHAVVFVNARPPLIDPATSGRSSTAELDKSRGGRVETWDPSTEEAFT